jgi:geranylgeranyl pyrophosphate synthase
MSILAVIRREEKKVKKRLAKLQADLIGLQSAARVLGKTAGRDISRAKKHVLSAKGRAKISKAMKKRWAKVRAKAKKAVAK